MPRGPGSVQQGLLLAVAKRLVYDNESDFITLAVAVEKGHLTRAEDSSVRRAARGLARRGLIEHRTLPERGSGRLVSMIRAGCRADLVGNRRVLRLRRSKHWDQHLPALASWRWPTDVDKPGSEELVTMARESIAATDWVKAWDYPDFARAFVDFLQVTGRLEHIHHTYDEAHGGAGPCAGW